jgi:hypothetical protein
MKLQNVLKEGGMKKTLLQLNINIQQCEHQRKRNWLNILSFEAKSVL